MSNKPIFVATHPRACSTAFERTIHEPFGDAFYFGPERMGTRFEDDEQARLDSGYSQSTFKTIVDRIDEEAAEGKRVFIKDITHYLLPPAGQPSRIAPSLSRVKRGVGTEDSSRATTPESGRSPSLVASSSSSLLDPKDVAHMTDSGIGMSEGEDGAEVASTTAARPRSPPFPYVDSEAEVDNPTVVPRAILEKFHFTFLIRHPRSAIPSYYRCCIPPLLERTHFSPFLPSEAGYDELRRLFDYLKSSGMIGPRVCGQDGQQQQLQPGQVEICVVDADDMLDDPEGILRQYCASIGLDFHPEMLNWDSEEAHQFAKDQFEKWNGFHDDAINSTDLKPRQHKKKPKSDEEMYEEWKVKYGQEAADMIKRTVDENVADYEYLKQFAIKV